VVDTIDVKIEIGGFTFDLAPTDITINQTGTKLYVATDDWDNAVVIDTSTKKIIKEIDPVSADKERGIALHPEKEIIYITEYNNDNLLVFDVNTNRLITGVKVDDGPFDVKILGSNNLPPPPAAPSSLTATATSSSSIVLAWKDNSNNETGFKAERKLGACDSANAWALIATKEANAKTHTNTGLTANTTYSCRVRAYNEGGNSAYSNCASAKTALSGTPKSPTNLSATSLSANQVKLIWTDNSTDETSFKVYRRVGSGSWPLLATKGANIVSHTDTGAPGNTSTTTYSYYIQACNSSGCSPKTNYAIVPYKPANLSTTAISSSKINLTWTDKSNNETGFEIYRRLGTCSSDSGTRIATVGANITSYSNIGLSSSTTYSYRTRAYTKSPAMPYAYGYSYYSNCDDATTP